MTPNRKRRPGPGGVRRLQQLPWQRRKGINPAPWRGDLRSLESKKGCGSAQRRLSHRLCRSDAAALMNVVEFIESPTFLTPFFVGGSWDTWKACLRALYALPMTRRDRTLFAAVSGARKPPRRPADEFEAALADRPEKTRSRAAWQHSRRCVSTRTG